MSARRTPTRVLVMMGSGAEAAEEAVEALTKRGEKVGLVKVRLYRPFSVAHFLLALPPTVRRRWPFSTAPRNPAPSASRFTWM